MFKVQGLISFPAVAADLQAHLAADAEPIGAMIVSVSVRRATKAAAESTLELEFDAAPNTPALDASIAQYIANNS